MSTTLASLYLTKLLVIGCTGTDPDQGVGNCPTSVEPQTWVGLASMSECEQYVRTKDFDPDDYLPGWPSYIVRCTH